MNTKQVKIEDALSPQRTTQHVRHISPFVNVGGVKNKSTNFFNNKRPSKPTSNHSTSSGNTNVGVRLESPVKLEKSQTFSQKRSQDSVSRLRG
jgi:hypothetical protein